MPMVSDSTATNPSDSSTIPYPENAPPAGPVTAAERISSLDVLRGVAVLGILMMNITSFALPMAAYVNPAVAGGDSGANLAVWYLNHILFHGKMRAIFSMLFGAGFILLTERAEKRGGTAQSADIYYRRILWLILFGLVHAYFFWYGDILYMYGVAGLVLFPFRKVRAGWLLAMGLLTLTIIPAKSVWDIYETRTMRAEAEAANAAAAAGQQLTDEQVAAQKAWADKLKELEPDAKQIAKEIADHHAGYWTLFLKRMKTVVQFQSVFYYRYGFFDVMSMMLIGMAFLKWGVFSAARSYRFYLILTALSYGIGLPLNAYLGWLQMSHHFDWETNQLAGWAAHDFYRFLVVLGHIGALMLVCKAGLLTWLTRRLAAIGRMALSNYLFETLVSTVIFDRLGYFGELERYQLVFFVLAVWILQLGLSPIWLRYFRFGPMEWLWRTLTYWKLQPILVRKEVDSAWAAA
jgi:uncharacterized protein